MSAMCQLSCRPQTSPARWNCSADGVSRVWALNIGGLHTSQPVSPCHVRSSIIFSVPTWLQIRSCMPENRRIGTPDSSSSGRRWTEGFVDAQKESLTCPLHSVHAEVLAVAWKDSMTSFCCSGSVSSVRSHRCLTHS